MRGRIAAWLIVIAVTSAAGARAEPAWQLHTTLEGDNTPALCKDTSSVGLIVDILARVISAKANSDSEKAKRLFEIAAKLQDEICLRPGKEDIVILRCALDQRQIGNSTVSLVKMSALLHADVSAGEQPFYGWTYAQVAGGDNKGADTKDADKKWCGEQTVADARIEATPDLVQRIQTRLYDFGLYVPQIDGTLNAETTEALIAFQKWAGLPATGQPTKLTVEKIDSTTAPNGWLSLAYEAFGKNALLEGATRRVAEEKAVAALRRTMKGEYKVFSVPNPDCLALSTTSYKHRRTSYGQAFVGVGRSDSEAQSDAMASCNRQKTGGTCKVRTSVCPAGVMPPRYEPDNMPVNSPAPSETVPRYEPENIPANSAAPAPRYDPEDISINGAPPPRR